MMRKKIIYIASLTLMALGLGAATTTQSVSAAVANPIQQGKRLNLTRKATVFNKKGVKVGHLRKGRVYKIRALRIINGDTYVKIGRNRFVKEEAFLPYLKPTMKVENRIKRPSFIYDENGEKIPGKFVKRGAKVNNLGHKEINEKPFIKIAEGQYVKAFNVLTTIINY